MEWMNWVKVKCHEKGFRLAPINRVKQCAKRVTKRLAQRGLILVYHRVEELESDPQKLAVESKHFAEHLEILRRETNLMKLNELGESVGKGRIIERASAVTFDDGYADNLYHAKPLLEHYKVPATFFVTSGYIDQQREFWWDEIERLILEPGMLPKTLDLNVNGKTYQWQLSESAHYSEEDYQALCWWNVLEMKDPSPRQRLYRSLCELLHPLGKEERQRVLDDLRAWGGTEPVRRPNYRALSEEEVLILGDGDLFEIGAHTMGHFLLSALPKEQQWLEIQNSKAHLEEVLGHAVTSFSYPFGSRGDYTAETVGIVKDSGFDLACSNYPDLVWRFTDRFQLPRFLVRNWNGDVFLHYLEGWLKGENFPS